MPKYKNYKSSINKLKKIRWLTLNEIKLTINEQFERNYNMTINEDN